MHWALFANCSEGRALVSEALADWLQDGGAEELRDVIQKIIRSGGIRAGTKLVAIQEVCDRVEGRPVQGHRIEATMDAETARALLELARRMGPSIVVELE